MFVHTHDIQSALDLKVVFLETVIDEITLFVHNCKSNRLGPTATARLRHSEIWSVFTANNFSVMEIIILRAFFSRTFKLRGCGQWKRLNRKTWLL